jgi:hypothetical protein
MPGLRSPKSSAFFLALALPIFLLGCQPQEDETLPQELMGVWRSSAPKYADCTLELSKELIIFTSGEFQDFINVNFIIKVERKPERNHVVYTIHYENAEKQRYKFVFYHYPSEGGVIRPKNQIEIEWRKVKPISG